MGLDLKYTFWALKYTFSVIVNLNKFTVYAYDTSGLRTGNETRAEDEVIYRVTHKECDFSDDLKLINSSEFECVFCLYL